MALISGSPAMSEKKFADAAFSAGEDTMTAEGTAIRAIIMILVVIGAALIPWTIFFSNFSYADNNPYAAEMATRAVSQYMFGGAIGGFVLALIIIFKMRAAPILALPYAFCEGLFLGGISATFEASYQGIVIQAAATTFIIFFVMLLLYTAKIIKPTAKLRAVVMSSMIAIMLMYLVNMILGFWGIQIPEVNGNGVVGIGVSVFICIIASLSLIFDFQVIESGVARRAPKYMSWYGAFAMIVTLVWLYLEILRLIAKVRSRD